MSFSNVSGDSDDPLLLALIAGDHDAFEQIYHTYKKPIIRLMLRILKSPVLVEEVVQELFLKVWDNKESIDPSRPIQAYLYKIGANMAKNTLRKAYYDKKMREMLEPLDNQVYMQVDEHINKKENRELLERILSYLPERRRQVYKLCKIDQLSYKQVAEQLAISENAVNDHIKKANVQIRDIVLRKEFLLILLTYCIREIF